MTELIDLKTIFAFKITSSVGVTDARIFSAFAEIDRQVFLGTPPWYKLVTLVDENGQNTIEIVGDTLDFVYDDEIIAIDRARRINNGYPSLHALCLNALAIKEGHEITHVGAGTGYYTAVLAEITGPTGHIFAFEIEADLANRARDNLSAWPWVNVRAVSATSGTLPPADRIYVNAGTSRPLRIWLDALRPGGRLIFPLQPAEGVGGMLLIQKPADTSGWFRRFTKNRQRWSARFVSPGKFIPIQDGGKACDRDTELKAAFENGGLQSVKYIYFDNEPDKKCWFKGDGWWLST